MIAVRLNGRVVEIGAGLTVADVVRAHVDERRGVAVALNAEVVPRSSWPTTTLAHGDHIEIVRPVPGG